MNTLFRKANSRIPLLAVAATSGWLSSAGGTTTQAEEKPAQYEGLNGRTGLLFVGTGSSTGCPKPLCTMLFGQGDSQLDPQLRRQYLQKCQTSMAAIQGGVDPRHNKNYRNNPALLISSCTSQGQCHNVIIDAGKTFREGTLRWFPPNGVTSLDGIILTHHHMDAAGGLDDVRNFQRLQTTMDATSGQTVLKQPLGMIPMSLYLSQECLNDVSQRFPWLFPNQQETAYTSGTHNQDKPAVARHVASFDIAVFQDFQPMKIGNLPPIIPLPVWHGEDLISYGFAFTLGGKHILYISDISRMPDRTLLYILTQLPRTDILIVDALLPERKHPVHYSLKQAEQLARQVKAKQVWVVGMSCDAYPVHDEMNAQLRQQQQNRLVGAVNIQLAYDGQIIVLENDDADNKEQ